MSATPYAYSDTIIAEQNLLAYWPLSDQQGAPTTLQGSTSIGPAKDLSGHGHDGAYIIPPLYPNPPVDSSARITIPAINLQQVTIVPGDADSTRNPNPGSAALGGGYISIPWSTQNPPKLDQFTFEAWLQPYWSSGVQNAYTLFSALARDSAGNTTGFSIVIVFDNATNQNLLQIVWGDGTATTQQYTSTVGIDSASLTYVAVTGAADTGGGTFTFFANAQNASPLTDSKSGTGYVATDTARQQVTFFIGAGRNDEAPRTRPGDMNGGPEFPYTGQMQSVALYKTALGGTVLQSHYSSGYFGE